MILVLANVLSSERCADIRAAAADLVWEDGAKTAGPTAAKVKSNLQADLGQGPGLALHAELTEAISGHPVFKAAARPRRVSKLLLSRTPVGGGYGDHVDNPLLGRNQARMRSDLSFTLFLTPLDAYAGGALVITNPGGEDPVRLAPGDLVLYPSTSIHRVETVTAGERLVCVGWVESLIRNHADRELLFELDNLRAVLRRRDALEPLEALTLDKVIANLTRMWADP
jgi:PKHD-type hydroxylase